MNNLEIASILGKCNYPFSSNIKLKMTKMIPKSVENTKQDMFHTKTSFTLTGASVIQICYQTKNQVLLRKFVSILSMVP